MLNNQIHKPLVRTSVYARHTNGGSHAKPEQKLEYISSDEDALALYRAREDSAHERANLIYTGRMEGKIEGKVEGIEEVAKNMLAKNTPIDFIAEVTGLSMEEIKALQAKINKKLTNLFPFSA